MATIARRSRTESARRNPIKAHGVHFTPPELAQFLARHTLSYLPTKGTQTILDPSCGDGELLAAVVDVAEESRYESIHLVGVDRDPDSVSATRRRLAQYSIAQTDVYHADFLASRYSGGYRQRGLFDIPTTSSARQSFPSLVDVIISNPPYVRTQVLGAVAAKKLAADYDLTGRVDLYHAFVRGMTDHLKEGGVLGLLCSNRFLTTQGGAALRELLWDGYELCEIFDLGDTKLFAAAVLPAIIIARKRPGAKDQHTAFTRIYEVRETRCSATSIAPSVPEAIDAGVEGLITIQGLTFDIERGMLHAPSSPTEPWTMTSPAIADWLMTVERHTDRTFADVGAIRVGLKTTADSVFIRKEWASLPEGEQPEAELVHPLLTHHDADQWSVKRGSDSRSVLYPHILVNGRRRPVDLDQFPRAKAYLEHHRDQLTARSYVIKGGRQWFEIWVPQNPADWVKPKIVFPDISEKPRFFLDTSGAIVNGDCYWITVEDKPDLGALMLAVANSTFAVKFYDSVCSNRLYAGRRRFISQYVKRFPLPRLNDTERSYVSATVNKVILLPVNSRDRKVLIEELDLFVWSAFGLPKESVRQANL